MAEVCNKDQSSATSRGFQGRKQSCVFLQKSPNKLFEDDEDPREEENRVPKYHHHFLESCFLCERRFDGDDDIFMYKGEKAFCSEECREQHMEMDELKERRMRRMKKLSTIKEMSRENRSSSSSHSTTIAVA